MAQRDRKGKKKRLRRFGASVMMAGGLFAGYPPEYFRAMQTANQEDTVNHERSGARGGRDMQLVGNDIHLRTLKETDASALLYLNLKNREFFQSYLNDRVDEFYTLDYQIGTIRASLASLDRDEEYSFGLFLTASQKLIGKVSLTQVVRGPLQSCWLGYYLDQAQNGHGYVTEAVKLVVEYAFTVLRLHRIEAGVMPRNQASIRVLEKAGFEREGLSKKNVRINGQWEDHFLFAIVNHRD